MRGEWASGIVPGWSVIGCASGACHAAMMVERLVFLLPAHSNEAKMSWKIAYLITVVVGLVLLIGWKTTARGAYESAEYTVIATDGEFEIREYPRLALVSTSMPGKREGDGRSFMRLFQYIRGANEASEKIAMTTPVFMQSQTQTTEAQMAFVIPKKLAADGPPKPENDRVELQHREGGRFAVIRFAGRLSDESAAQAEKRLKAWMSQRGLIAGGTAETAGYDPPWTPGPLRRNEVLIRLK